MINSEASEDVQIRRSTQDAGKDVVWQVHVFRMVCEFKLLQPLQKVARGPVDVDAPEHELIQIGCLPAEGGKQLLEVQQPEVIVVVIVIIVIEVENLELGRFGNREQRGEDAVHDLIIVHHELENTPSPCVQEDKVSHDGEVDRGHSAGKPLAFVLVGARSPDSASRSSGAMHSSLPLSSLSSKDASGRSSDSSESASSSTYSMSSTHPLDRSSQVHGL